MYTNLSCILVGLLVLILQHKVNGQDSYSPFQHTNGKWAFQKKISPTYIVTAPRLIRPDGIYRLAISLLPESPDMVIKATITKREHQITTGSIIADSGSSVNLIMKVPESITEGQYRLRVEGFDTTHPQSAVFSQEEDLMFNPQFLSIIVESNRAVYNKEMEVKFRVILMQMDLKPYSDPITVFILDPEGYIMRRWPSQYPTNGVVSLMYQLPAMPREGKWTIRVEALAQVYEKQIFVERYFLTFFEVLPLAPLYVLDTDKSYKTEVTLSFHDKQIVKGNITSRIYVKGSANEEFKLVRQDFHPWNAGFEYEVDLEEVNGFTSQLVGSLIRVEFIVRDFFLGEERSGYIETRVIRANLKLHFAGSRTAVFKPGMSFSGQVYVMYDDNAPLTGEKLASARLTIHPTATLSSGHVTHLPDIIVPKQGDYHSSGSNEDELMEWMDRQAQDVEYRTFRTSGVYQFRFTVPKDATSLKIQATYQDEDGDEASAELQTVPYYSPHETFLYVYSSTEQGRIGESAIFHVKSNFAFERFQYVIVSKGAIVYSTHHTLAHASRSTNFAVTISNEMVPTFKVVVMVTTPFGDVIADSVTVPVQSINRFKMNITLVQSRDHSKQTVQFVTRSHPGSFVGVSALRLLNYQFQGDNTVSPGVVLRSLYALEPFPKSVSAVTWTDREGLKADETQYFVGQNPGPDAWRTFAMAGLHVFTDARIDQYPDSARCNKSAGMFPCLLTGCIKLSKTCNGHPDCVDGSDEDDCPSATDDKTEFRIFRQSRSHDFYDWEEGDWAWYDIPLTDDGEEFHDRPVPPTIELWYINAFSFHPDLGFSVLDGVTEYDSSPPVSFIAEAPESIRRGEILGIRLLGINALQHEVMVLIILEASDDYRFVETGPDGEVEHYKPRLVEGEKHHVVTLKADSMLEVDIPIAPQIEQGTISVNIQTISQYSHQDHQVELNILPEGATINRHTSLLLDLKNRANLLRFLDIDVEESPVIPYSKFRRYVYGSPRASVTLCGDVFGPVMPTSASTGTFLNRPLQSVDSNLFSLAATSWSLHYLRLTNQLDKDVMYEAFRSMNSEMAGLMRLFHPSGSFQMHKRSNPSVWTTAWVIRVLGQSQFQDWENHYFVDRKLLSSSVKWIIDQQNPDGTFHETDVYSLPIDRTFANNSRKKVAHTAHVLIAFMKCSDSLQGSLKVTAANAKSRSLTYLQRMLNTLQDPYDIAIVSHALSISNNQAKETAFAKLHDIRRENDGMIYWSRNPVPANNLTYKNQRPFVQPRLPSQQDALAVETTAYALLVYLARDGIGDLQERVVTWLNTMRMTPAGFVSIFDTIVAMEALTEYAYRARLRDITDMSVVIEASASSDARKVVHIDSDNLASIHRLEVPNVWGHINVIGRGAGQAVMQLNVQYGIDVEDLRDTPSRPYFNLYVDETYSHFRNKSHINVTACAQWLALDESPHSATAILEIDMPSGYNIITSDAEQVVEKSEFSFLRDVLVAKDKVVWVIDKLGKERTCFSYELRRWFPVANMTLYRSAIIYESYSPEHFEMFIFNATPLYVLDICEVCGSFQCPYCPYFSSAPRNVVITSVLFTCLCFIFRLPWLFL